MRRGPRRRAVVDQRAQAEQRQRVADVDRDRHAVQRVQRRPAAALLALVLDVVVDEEGVVQQLERDRRAHRVLDARAEGARRRDAQARPQHAAAAARVVGDEAVEMARGSRGRR